MKNETSQPAPARPRRGHWVLFASVALLAAGGITYYWQTRAPGPPQIGQTGLDPAIIKSIDGARADVESSPRSSKAWGRLGMIFLAYDYHQEASACFVQAEKLDPREPHWPFYLALILTAGDKEKAVPKYERAVELVGKVSDVPRLRVADLLMALDRLDEAERHFSELVRLQPGHVRAQLGLGRVALRRGDAQKSLEHLQKAATDVHTRNAAQGMLAEAHRLLGDEAAAARAQKERAAAPPDQPWPDPFLKTIVDFRVGKNANIARARELFLENQVQKGIALVEKTLRDYPDEPYLWFMLGKARLNTKELDAAETALRKSLALERKSVQAEFLLGLVLADKGDVPGAKESFRKTTVLKADFALGHYNYGLCLLKESDRKGAIEAFRITTQAQPSFVKAHLSLAQLLLKDGQSAEALVHAQQAATLSPNDADAAKLLEEVRKARPASTDP